MSATPQSFVDLEMMMILSSIAAVGAAPTIPEWQRRERIWYLKRIEQGEAKRPSSTSSRSGGADGIRRSVRAGGVLGNMVPMFAETARVCRKLQLLRGWSDDLGVHLALSAGQTPAQAALSWCRSQIGLPAATAAAPMAMNDGILCGPVVVPSDNDGLPGRHSGDPVRSDAAGRRIGSTPCNRLLRGRMPY